MSVITTQNFDSTITGWNNDANLTAVSNASAVSSPNVLSLASGATSSTLFYATYAMADGAGGNVVVSAYFNFGSNHNNALGLTARGSAATLNNSSTSFYLCQLKIDPSYPSLGSSLTIGAMASGTLTPLASLTIHG
jgi:hypothetical protein